MASSHGNAGEGNPEDEFSGLHDALTMPQTCRALNMSRPAVLRLIKGEKLIGYMVGNQHRVKKTEIRRFLEQGNHPNSKNHKD